MRPHGGRTRAWRRGAAAFAAILTAFGGATVIGTSAHAANIIPVNPKLCVGGGSLLINRVSATLWTWTVTGSGPCQELAPIDDEDPSVGVPVEALESVSFHGSGTSTKAGYCSKPHTFVRDLNIHVTATFHSELTGDDTTVHQIWGAPYTTFPVVTPFLITSADTPVGAGVLSTRTGLKCDNAGVHPSTLFTWAEMLPPDMSPPPSSSTTTTAGPTTTTATTLGG